MRKKLKMAFSKRTFIIAGISYILVVLVFLIVFTLFSGFRNGVFGPILAAMISVYAVPFIVIGSIIHIIIKKQDIYYMILGYLILTLGLGIWFYMVLYFLLIL